MLLRSGRGVDVQVVTNKARIDARGVVGVPCEHVDIFSKKSDQLLLFLRGQFRTDQEELLRVIVDSDFV